MDTDDETRTGPHSPFFQEASLFYFSLLLNEQGCPSYDVIATILELARAESHFGTQLSLQQSEELSQLFETLSDASHQEKMNALSNKLQPLLLSEGKSTLAYTVHRLLMRSSDTGSSSDDFVDLKEKVESVLHALYLHLTPDQAFVLSKKIAPLCDLPSHEVLSTLSEIIDTELT